jgi:urease accessory protein
VSAPPAAWHARLALRFARDGARCIGHVQHEGPLRVLKTLYPEGDAIAHQVIVHPPGGIVGGDRLEIALSLDSRSHAVLTTPGATRFYRSDGRDAAQQVHVVLEDGARLEWLPLETIAHSGCLAENRAVFELASGAEMIGWDALALGLPASGETFEAGRFTTHVEWPGLWLERGTIRAEDARLLRSPLGFAGRSALLTMWFAAGRPIDGSRVDALVDGAREALAACGSADAIAGVTALHQRIVVLRALAHRIEPLMTLAQAVRARWRTLAWQLDDVRPRVWRT